MSGSMASGGVRPGPSFMINRSQAALRPSSVNLASTPLRLGADGARVTEVRPVPAAGSADPVSRPDELTGSADRKERGHAPGLPAGLARRLRRTGDQGRF